MSGIDTSTANGVRVTAFNASHDSVAHNATTREDSTGLLRAVMTGVEHQPSHNEGGFSL
jgi:hypothetical protein